MTDKTLGWTVRLGGVLAVLLFLWSIQWFLPDFYSTMWHLTVEGDIDGLTDYIASFGYAAILVSVFMIIFANAIGIPSIPFLTVNGVIFGLVPGIIISWAAEVIGIVISFRLTRTLLRNQAKKVIQRSNMLEKLDSYSCIRTIMMGRAIPYSPNVVVTAFSALSHISYKDHFIANALGNEHWERLLGLTILVVAIYGFLWWRKKQTQRNKS